MRRIGIAGVLLAISLTLGGCAGTKLGDLWQKATADFANPVDRTDIHRAELAYAAALELAVEYRRYCWSAPYATLMADPVARPICEKRRAAVRLMQRYRRIAGVALGEAQQFVANNPTLSAAGIVGAAWSAIDNFQRAIPAAK